MLDENPPAANAMDNLRLEIEALERRLHALRRHVEPRDPLPETFDVASCITGDAYVGVPLSNIECVVGIARLFPARDAAPWIRGLLNLRGVMIPIVDVGVRLGRPPRPWDPSDLILICSTKRRRVGLWVQSVRNVSTLQSAMVDREVPQLMGAPHLLGVAVLDGQTTQLLHVDAMLGQDEPAGGTI